MEPKIQKAGLEHAVGGNGDIEKYLKDNNIEMAAQHSTSVLSVVNNAKNEELAVRKKIKVLVGLFNSDLYNVLFSLNCLIVYVLFIWCLFAFVSLEKRGLST